MDDFHDLIQRDDYVNFKSRLLEHTQSKGNGHPRYLVHAEEGPDHDKLFSVEVSVTGQRVGRGQGRSKKEAQQMAAKDALQKLVLFEPSIALPRFGHAQWFAQHGIGRDAPTRSAGWI